MGVIKEKFGVTKDGREVYAYTLSNANGMSAKIIDYGAILVSLMVPDQNGVAEDVVLGYDSMEGYFANGSFFGATIGPSANRIGGASFEIDTAILRDILIQFLESERVLGRQSELGEQAMGILERLPGFGVGRHGQRNTHPGRQGRRDGLPRQQESIRDIQSVGGQCPEIKLSRIRRQKYDRQYDQSYIL